MRTLGVVPNQPGHELLVEVTDIAPQKRKVALDEVVGESAIETLHGAVHFRTPRIRVVVHDVELLAGVVEMERKLASVVGLDFGNGKRRHLHELLEEVLRRFRRVSRVASCEGKLLVDVDGGVDVALRVPYKADDRVDFKSLLVLLVAAYLLPFLDMTFVDLTRSGVERDLGVIRQKTALLEITENASRLGFTHAAEHGDLLLAELWMVFSQLDDRGFELWRNAAGSSSPWRSASLVETVELALLFLECGSPPVQGTSRDGKRFLCRFEPVPFPKYEYS